MDLSNLIGKASKLVESHSAEILTSLGVAGVITTSYLSAKAAHKAAVVIRVDEERNGFIDEKKERVKRKALLTWKLYVPAAISGAVTIGCVIGASRVSGNRTAAAITAYSITEKAFTEYKEKVVDQIGENKERKIRDEIAQDKVTQNPPGKEVVVLGKGNVLCCELFTRRYFRSDMDTLKKAENKINARIVNEIYVPLDEFYDLIGMAHTSHSSRIGWNSDKLLELEFTTTLSEDGEPCLAFDYNYTKPL